MSRRTPLRDVERIARHALVALFSVVAGCGTEAPPEPVPAQVATREPAPPAREGPVAAVAATAGAEPDAAPESDLPMLLDFTRDHCLPCEIMAPWVEELRRKHAGHVQVKEINIDRPGNRELGQFFKTRSIPTQVYVDAKGREVSRHAGLATKEQMQRTLERLGFVSSR